MRQFLSFLLLPILLGATELSPYFEDPFVIYFIPSYQLQNYTHVQEGNKTKHFNSTDHFVNFSLLSSIFDTYSIELDFNTAATPRNHFSMNNAQITGRILLLDDVTAEDPISLSIGETISYANKPFVNDVSVFHHGQWEFMSHLSLGKEISHGAFWCERVYATALLGFANQDSPWFFARATFETNYLQKCVGGVYIGCLIGFGSKILDVDHFQSYGPIRHRSVNIGAFLEFPLKDYGSLKAELSFIPWSANYPIYVGQYTVSYSYPF